MVTANAVVCIAGKVRTFPFSWFLLLLLCLIKLYLMKHRLTWATLQVPLFCLLLCRIVLHGMFNYKTQPGYPLFCPVPYMYKLLLSMPGITKTWFFWMFSKTNLCFNLMDLAEISSIKILLGCNLFRLPTVSFKMKINRNKGRNGSEILQNKLYKQLWRSRKWLLFQNT